MSKTKTNQGKRHVGRLELRGKKWLAIWMVDGKRYSMSTGLEDKAAAQEWLDRKLDAYRTLDALRETDKDEATIRGTMQTILGTKLTENEQRRKEIEDAAHALTIDEAWMAYVNDPNRKEVLNKTLHCTQMRFDGFVKWLKSNYPKISKMRDVTPAIAKQYAAVLRKLYVPASYTISISSLCQIWSRLTDEIRGTVNPWDKDHLARAGLGGSERRALTDAELNIIFKKAKLFKPPLERLFMMLLYTGARLSDCALMKWEYVDLQRGFISFIPIKNKRFKEKARVKIPIMPPLYAMLERFPSVERKGYIMPDMAQKYESGVLNECITNFLKTKCKIETKVKNGVGTRAHSKVSAHSFRHTFVSKAANAGIPFAIVQRIVGHSTAKMLEHYFHDNEQATLREFTKFPMLKKATPQIVDDSVEVIDAEVIEFNHQSPRVNKLKQLIREIVDGGDAVELEAAKTAMADIMSR